jgi:alkanesulfonate monooxygenase SsuD/methylene tetrahydromethanopterin reductase-like flavin-dependent oxidoreductase (luciferase family)
MTSYRRHFRPSGWREAPYAILAVAAIAADTDAEAEQLAASADLNRLLRDRGQYGPLPSIEEAQAFPYSESDRASIARNRSRLFVGSPATVVEKLTPLIEATEADEVMVITAVYDHAARRRSYELLAEAFGPGKR